MLRRRFLTACLIAVLSCAPLGAQKKPPAPKERPDISKFRARVEAALADAKAEKGHWALLVTDAATGDTLYTLNAQRYFAPASNTKLFTTVLAMATLGPDYRFRTTIETRGTTDRHARLRGDLVLVARGDPNLSNRKFPYEKKVERDGPAERVLAELADGVAACGIKQVEGDVVVDDSYFLYERYPSGWAIDDMAFGHGAPVSAISLNDNTLAVEIRPGETEGAPAWFGVEPWADFYTFANEIITGAAGSQRRVWANREPGSRRITLGGTIPLDAAEPYTLTLAIEEPAEYTATLLKRLLEARGVRVYGQARARHTPEAGGEAPAVLAEHTSLPLLEAVRLVNKVSQNLHAEMLLRAVGREKSGTGSTEAGLKVAQEFFKSIGIAEGDVATYDGSGLSRRNLITPRAAVKLLQYVAQQPWGEAYIATLPVAAEDGTLTERMKNLPAAGRIRAKTGTLGNVNALSGFATTLHGTQLIFSMFGNSHGLRGREVTDILDAICVAMVEEIGAPPPKKKRR